MRAGTQKLKSSPLLPGPSQSEAINWGFYRAAFTTRLAHYTIFVHTAVVRLRQRVVTATPTESLSNI